MNRQQQKLLRAAATRHGRKKKGVFLCEGPNCCREALTHAAPPPELVVLSESYAQSASGSEFFELCAGVGAEPEIVSDPEFTEYALTENPQGVLAVLPYPTPPADDEIPAPDPLILVLDRIQDPGNLGTVLRTAWAAGLAEVWLTRGTTDPFGPKAVRSGAGAQFALVFRYWSELSSAAEAALNAGAETVWCAMPNGGISCFDRQFRLLGTALVIGNEAGGIMDDVLCRPVTVPMPGGAESLNAAQAATVFLYETVRQTQHDPSGSGEKQGMGGG